MGDAWVIGVNSAAGRRPVVLARLEKALFDAGIEADIESVGNVDEMRRFAREAATAERLAVVGGDGTLNLVVNALFEADAGPFPILGVVPAGTGCDLLRTFGIPQDMESAAHHLRGDDTYTIDVGEVSGDWGVRRFVNVAQAGVGAAAAETAAKLPRALGAQRYIAAFGMRLPRFPGGEVELVTERRTHTGTALAVIMANAQFFAGGWNVAPKAMLVDGAFDLQVIDATKMSAPKLVPKVVAGLHLREPGVTRISSPTFRLDTQYRWPVEVDGDAIGNTPLHGRVVPAAMRLKI